MGPQVERRRDYQMDKLEAVPARQGRALRLSRGQRLKLVNSHGTQVLDFWAYNAADPREFLSMEHLRVSLGRIRPRRGDFLVTNRRRPILYFEEDSSPGVHDTLIAACDCYRYAALGCRDYHDNCTDNHYAALRAIGVEASECPAPLNLWMNVGIAADGSLSFEAPVAAAGDYVVLRAELDCLIALSACPQDLLPVNGRDCEPKEVHFAIC